MARRFKMQHRRIGQGQVAEAKAEAVFRFLLEACNNDPMFLVRSADVARAINESALGLNISPASVSQAISWLQARDYIDAGKKGKNVYVFVRFPRWIGDKKITSADYEDGERIWGHPFKWWDSSVLFRGYVLNLFDGLHDVKIHKQLGPDNAPFFRVVGKTQADMCRKHGVHPGQQSSDGLDILNTWHMARQYRNGPGVVKYEIVRFTHDSPTGFRYEPKVDRSKLFPDPGYLGKPLGLPVVPPIKPRPVPKSPAHPEPKGEPRHLDNYDAQTGVPLSVPDDITVQGFTNIDLRPRQFQMVGFGDGQDARGDTGKLAEAETVTEPEKDPPRASQAFTGRPVGLALLEQDIQDHGIRAAMMIYEIGRGVEQFPESPEGAEGVWVRGPGMLPGDFGGFFGVNPAEIMNAMVNLAMAGRLQYFTGKDGTFYRTKPRSD